MSEPSAPLGMAGAVGGLLERERELAALEAAVAGAASGAGRAVVVEGPAGIGKTRLIGEGRRLAGAAGLQVLAARGSELEEAFAYGVVRQLFEPLLATASDDVRAELLAGAARLATPLFDERRLAAAVSESGGAGFATLHGLYWLAWNLAAQRPVLVVVDDLQWADAPSLRWLLYLAHRLDGVPLLLLAGVRRPAHSRGGALLAEFVSESQVVSLRLGALTRGSVAALVRDAFAAEPEDEFCDACRRATGGNPLFLRALVATLAAEGVAPTAAAAAQVAQIGPEPVARAVAVRLARLPAAATELARATAILGDGAQLGIAGEVAGLDPGAAGAAAQQLHRVGLIDLEPRLAFSHPIVRAAIYGGIDPVDRAVGHRRAAALLSAAGVEPEQPAAHLLLVEAGGEPFAVPVLRQAARRALARGAPDAAVTYLTHVLDEPAGADDRWGVLRELGLAELATDPVRAIEHLRIALDAVAEPAVAAQIALHMNRAFVLANRPEEAVTTLRAALARLGPEASAERDLLDIALINWAGWAPGLKHVAVERLAALRAGEAGGEAGPHVCATLAFYEARLGTSAARSAELAHRTLAAPNIFRSLDVGMTSILHAGMTLTFAGEMEAATRAYAALIAEARRQGHRVAAATGLLFRAFLNLQRGDLRAAEEDLFSPEVSASRFTPVGRGFLAAWQTEWLVERGELARAVEVARASPIDEQPAGHSLFQLCARGRAALEAGDPRAALADLEQVAAIGASLEPLPARNPAVLPWRSLAALAHQRLGRTDAARALAREELELARRWAAPRTVGVALRTLASIDDGEARLREAVDVLADSPARLEHAKALVELGAALRRGNRRAEARSLLREGVELAHRCGAPALVERANDELAATGAHRRTIMLSGLESLTASERRVAQLAAADLSNKQIAEALFVTVKTVETHLGRVYRKLDVTSRRQLAPTLAGAEVPERSGL